MRVALFVSCLADLMRPSIAFSAIRLLEAGGCSVRVPRRQTCCGRPAFAAGDRAATLALARKTIAELEGGDYVVTPSASCADLLRNEYPLLFADDVLWRARAERLAAQVFELTDFLASVLRLAAVPGRFSGSVCYHDSCTGLRRLGLREQPRALLALVPGLSLRELAASEECCGFGGSFSLQFGALSAHIAARKCAAIRAAGAAAVVGGELGCLLNIEGTLRRMGDATTRVLHIAEVLAGSEGKLA
jgi:L-lactate dehydrogenase complex protein LldE